MSMSASYPLDGNTKNIVFELLKKCIDLKLGNISFCYFYAPNHNDEVTFSLNEYKSYWELTVRSANKKTLDIYKIKDLEELIYQHTEK